MSIEAFYTSQNGQVAKNYKAHDADATSSSDGSTDGVHFFDAFLQLTAERLSAQKNAQNIDNKQLTETQTKLTPDVLTASQIVSDNLSSENSENMTIADIAALNNKLFNDTIIATQIASENASAGTPQQAPDILSTLFIDGADGTQTPQNTADALQNILQKITALMDSDSPSLILENITPERLTELQDTLSTLQNSDELSSDELGTFMVGLVALLPPQNNAPKLTKSGGIGPVSMTPKQIEILQSASSANQASVDLAGKLNTLSVGAEMSSDGEAALFFEDDGNALTKFEKFLKDFSPKGAEKAVGADGYIPNAATNNGQSANTAAPATHVLQGWPFSMEGSLFGAVDYSMAELDQFGIPTGQSATSLSPLTSLVTQSQSAAQAHPATHMVAAQMQKAASSGESKSITLRLDPPELGRVEIKMSFNKDKTMQAVLTAEKPETFMMLQRDSQILERALHETGLDASADGALSFELADDGQNFGQDGSHDGARNNTGPNGENADKDDVIETTMTWHVNPDTGHMHYNILA